MILIIIMIISWADVRILQMRLLIADNHHHHPADHICTQLSGDQSIADEIAAVNTSTNFSLFTLLRF